MKPITNHTSVINNRKVLENTVFLYIRMFFIMLIGFYSVRLALDALGVLDYGIYNVVGSIVMLCQFLTGSLTATSNRFFSSELVKGDKQSLNNCFCLNVTAFGLLIFIAIIILETVGVWYVNEKMVIPSERLTAANIVYQLSVFSLGLSFVSVPYNALIIAHEKMSVYAYLGIFDAIARLVAVCGLYVCSYDRLVCYAIFIVLISCISTLITVVYCRSEYAESKYRFYWNKSQFREIFDFVGFYFIGSISFVIKSQGLNILINAFFSPAINAARAIAFQVDSAVKKFSDGYFTAAKPQIYKAYTHEEFAGLNLLINRTTIICLYTMAILALPVALNSDFLLSLWLKEVPEKASVFLQLVVIDSLLNIASDPVILSIMATAKQKWYQITEFALRCSTLPISYAFLKNGAQPEITVLVCVMLSFVSVFVRAFFLKRVFPLFGIKRYLCLIGKVIMAIGASYVISMIPALLINNELLLVLVSSIISIMILTSLFLVFVTSMHDRNFILKIIRYKLHI